MNEEIRADRRQFSRAALIALQVYPATRAEVEEHLDELESLVTTLGVETVDKTIVRISKPSPQYLVGKGKMEEISARLDALDADLLVFDDDLAPPQQHLWESKTRKAVIDRRKVIIDIFAQRAQTREARLQIELASMEYTLPRLKRAWTHLERQRGGGGFIGGAGEAQIEVDRRIVRDRIAKVRGELKAVRQQRDNQRKSRQRAGIPTAALVGYTNSGKSSLLNTLTEADVLQEDKLFATLDPTTRRLHLPNNQDVLLTDTVGFIRKLPTTLVEAFKATLEEAAEADYLIHVLDANHPQILDHYRVTNKVLEELGALDKPTLVVLNKCDLLGEETPEAEMSAESGGAVHLTSTRSGDGLDGLRAAIAGLMVDRMEDVHLRVPATRFDIVSRIHREAEVLEEEYGAYDITLHVLYPTRLLAGVREFALQQPEG